jgi:hypothetical protein
MEQNNTTTVTGCGDCPMCMVIDGFDFCNYPNHSIPPYTELFDVCPLKTTNSLTIQLKQDAPQT